MRERHSLTINYELAAACFIMPLHEVQIHSFFKKNFQHLGLQLTIIFNLQVAKHQSWNIITDQLQNNNIQSFETITYVYK